MICVRKAVVNVLGRALSQSQGICSKHTKEATVLCAATKAISGRRHYSDKRFPRVVPVTRPGAFIQWDDGLVLRPMTYQETYTIRDGFAELYDIGREDIQLAWELSHPAPGSGFYAAEYEVGQMVGGFYAFPMTDKLSVPGHLYINKDHGGKRIMWRLLRFVTALTPPIFLGEGSAHMRIEAEAIGHKYKWDTYSVRGQVPPISVLPEGIVDVSAVSSEQLLAYDNKCFIVPNTEFRKRLLPRWFSLDGSATYVALDNNQEVVGFISRRPTTANNVLYIGPWYANDDTIAERLLLALGKGMAETEKLHVDIWELATGARAITKKYGFEESYRLSRLETGPSHEFKPTTYSVTGVDFSY